MVKRSFFFFLIFFTTMSFAGDIIYPICAQSSCPFIARHQDSYIKINCKDQYTCTLYYGNKTLEKKFPNEVTFSADTQIIWITDNLAQIWDSTTMDDNWSIFIDFNTMKYSGWFNNVFAVNSALKIVAYDADNDRQIQLSPMFNSTVKVLLPPITDSADGLSSAVKVPDTHFDSQGNLILFYFINPKQWQLKTKTIPIDYHQLEIGS